MEVCTFVSPIHLGDCLVMFRLILLIFRGKESLTRNVCRTSSYSVNGVPYGDEAAWLQNHPDPQ